jgi:hypothetical protein
MFQKTKAVTDFLANMSEKAGPLNATVYAISRGAGARKKGGPPEMKVFLTMLMKTKGKKKCSGNV